MAGAVDINQQTVADHILRHPYQSRIFGCPKRLQQHESIFELGLRLHKLGLFDHFQARLRELEQQASQNEITELTNLVAALEAINYASSNPRRARAWNGFATCPKGMDSEIFDLAVRLQGLDSQFLSHLYMSLHANGKQNPTKAIAAFKQQALQAIQVQTAKKALATLDYILANDFRVLRSCPARFDEDVFYLAKHMIAYGMQEYLFFLRMDLANNLSKNPETAVAESIKFAWNLISRTKKLRFASDNTDNNKAIISQAINVNVNKISITLPQNTKTITLDFTNSQHYAVLQAIYAIAEKAYLARVKQKDNEYKAIFIDRTQLIHDDDWEVVVQAINDDADWLSKVREQFPELGDEHAKLRSLLLGVMGQGPCLEEALEKNKKELKDIKVRFNRLLFAVGSGYRIVNQDKHVDEERTNEIKKVYNGYWLNEEANLEEIRKKKNYKKAFNKPLWLRWLQKLLLPLVSLNEGIVAATLAGILLLPLIGAVASTSMLLLIVGVPGALISYVLVKGALKYSFASFFNKYHMKNKKGEFIYKDGNGKFYFKKANGHIYCINEYDEEEIAYWWDAQNKNYIASWWDAQNKNYIASNGHTVDRYELLNKHLFPHKVRGLYAKSSQPGATPDLEVSLGQRRMIIFGLASSIAAALSFGIISLGSNWLAWGAMFASFGVACPPAGLAALAILFSLVAAISLAPLFYSAWAQVVKNGFFNGFINFLGKYFNLPNWSKLNNSQKVAYCLKVIAKTILLVLVVPAYMVVKAVALLGRRIKVNMALAYWSKMTWKQKILHAIKGLIKTLIEVALLAAVAYLLIHLAAVNIGFFLARSIKIYALTHLSALAVAILGVVTSILGSSMNWFFEATGLILIKDITVAVCHRVLSFAYNLAMFAITIVPAILGTIVGFVFGNEKWKEKARALFSISKDFFEKSGLIGIANKIATAGVWTLKLVFNTLALAITATVGVVWLIVRELLPQKTANTGDNIFKAAIKNSAQSIANAFKSIRDKIRKIDVATILNAKISVQRALLTLCVVMNTLGQKGAGSCPSAVGASHRIDPNASRSVLALGGELAWGLGSFGPNYAAVLDETQSILRYICDDVLQDEAFQDSGLHELFENLNAAISQLGEEGNPIINSKNKDSIEMLRNFIKLLPADDKIIADNPLQQLKVSFQGIVNKYDQANPTTTQRLKNWLGTVSQQGEVGKQEEAGKQEDNYNAYSSSSVSRKPVASPPVPVSRMPSLCPIL